MSRRNVAFITRDHIKELPADLGAALYLCGGFRRYHVLAADANEYHGSSRRGYLPLFDDELVWNVVGGYDDLEEAKTTASRIAARASDPMAERHALVWDTWTGERVFDPLNG